MFMCFSSSRMLRNDDHFARITNANRDSPSALFGIRLITTKKAFLPSTSAMKTPYIARCRIITDPPRLNRHKVL